MLRDRRHPFLSLLLVLGLLLAAVGSSEPAGARTAPGTQPTTGTIGGTVRDGDGDPIAGARVELVDGRVAEPVTTTTAADGSYRAEVQAGRWAVRVVAHGYQTMWAPGTPRISDAAIHQVDPGTDVDGIDVTLEPGADLTGRITDPDGRGVEGARVWAFAPGDVWLGSLAARSGADGSYRIEGLAPLDYRIAVVAPAGSGLQNRWADDPVRVEPGVDRTGFDVALDAGASIRGRVTDPDGQPLGGVSVTAWSPTDRWIAGAGSTTAADGTYVIEGLDPGSYKVRFGRADLTPRWSGPAMTRAAGAAVEVADTSAVTGIDSHLTPAYPYTSVSDLVVPDSAHCDATADNCHLPFPSDRFTVADPTTPTGRRVAFDPEGMPTNAAGTPVDPTHWNELDGFSPSAAMLLSVPGVDLDLSGTASLTDLAPSLDPDAPIVLLDVTAGERLAYWTELDSYAEPGTVPMMFIRPAEQLREGHRIVVGVRGLVDGTGRSIEPTPAFAAYRDLVRTGDPNLEDRRPAMERTFADLDAVGVERGDLQFAWDFTIASTEALSGRLLHMRDDAFARLDGHAPAFTVTYDQPSTREGVAREIRGTYEVPMYLTGSGEPGSEFVLGPDGLPTYTGTYTANFRCIIPPSATAADPAGVGLYGHGLLGTANQINAPWRVASQGNRVFCGTDLIGMAEEDVPNAVRILSDVSTFNTLADRLQQGHLNTLFLGRLLVAPDGFASSPSFQQDGTPLIDDDLVYYGISQGGIMGAATTAVAQDWTKATLDVAAINYGLLLDRSVDFDPFRSILSASYPAAADRALGLQFIQMLWDRGEASAYAQHLVSDPYPNTPVKQILLHAAFGDHQVANVGTAYEARTLGIPAHRPVLADGRSPEVDVLWDVPAITAYPHQGSAVVFWDSGAAVPPLTNQPPREGDDPHGDPRANPAAVAQIIGFFATGEVIDTCDGQACTGP
ncbi:MAG: carboxypeptidase regulatory-like domain-containing protein [Actinobacteria bacterium]|nr:carboxypeptidase regulatory-like domain-containing protein [Actinomycetota bacterium]